jgi:hypothetical protein
MFYFYSCLNDEDAESRMSPLDATGDFRGPEHHAMRREAARWLHARCSRRGTQVGAVRRGSMPERRFPSPMSHSPIFL